jgi:uncharacterized integral membrane protein
MRYLVIVLILLVAVVMVIFGAQNTQTVDIKFFTYSSGNVSLSLVIVLATLGGVVLSALVSFWSSLQQSIRERNTRRRLEREKRELEQRLALTERELARARGLLQSQVRAAAPPAGDQKASK